MVGVGEIAELRPMIASEAALFASWEAVERPYPWRENHFLASIGSSTQHVLVLDRGHRPVGFAAVQLVAGEAYLLNIMIASEYRRRGFGRALLDRVERWCKERGASMVWLDVDPANAPAVALYRRAGFEEIERRGSGYPRGEPAVLMRRRI